MENRPVRTGRSEFANARLPSADEEDAIVAETPPHEILDVSPDADGDVVEAAYRAKVKEAHPDQGGSAEALQRLETAKEQLLGE